MPLDKSISQQTSCDTDATLDVEQCLASELITGDSDDPPLSDETVTELLADLPNQGPKP